MAKTPLQRLRDLGQSPWIDYLSRDILRDGQLQELISGHGIVGVTSNPTIFQKAISSGSASGASGEGPPPAVGSGWPSLVTPAGPDGVSLAG